MGAVTTVVVPYRIELIPMDIVAISTKRHSCSVELKHSGRRPAVASSSTPGYGAVWDSTAVREASTWAIVNSLDAEVLSQDKERRGAESPWLRFGMKTKRDGAIPLSCL
jgi:hypothetical protein